MSPRQRQYVRRMRFYPGQERMLARLCHGGATARTNACAGITDTSKALEWLQELEKFGMVKRYVASGTTYWQATQRGRLRTGILRVGWRDGHRVRG